MSRYDISSSEGEYQPGSDRKVLRNLPEIKDPAEMNIAETDLLEDL
jgi:cell filamentation protein